MDPGDGSSGRGCGQNSVSPIAIALRNVDVGYRSRPIFAGLNLEIAKGSFHALLGPNGAGKTTLLKTIAGILPPLRGRVEYAEGSQIIGYVPQKETLDALYLFSAHDVALMGACREIGPIRRLGKQAREQASRMLELTGASEFADRLFSQLSGGQKQRALIARALMTHPQVLILDEPTAGVDPAASQSILQLLLKLQAERDMTVMLVTHDLALVRRHIRESIWVHEGAIQRGPTAELLAPKHIGEMLGIQLE
jgi:ABC-type Mn2+/Zn2+ transport system ATPase subunit